KEKVQIEQIGAGRSGRDVRSEQRVHPMAVVLVESTGWLETAPLGFVPGASVHDGPRDFGRPVGAVRSGGEENFFRSTDSPRQAEGELLATSAFARAAHKNGRLSAADVERSLRKRRQTRFARADVIADRRKELRGASGALGGAHGGLTERFVVADDDHIRRNR